MQTLFSLPEVATASPDLKAADCASCGLHKTCRSPRMPVFGQGRRGVLVVLDHPGATEDAAGRPLVGSAGQHLQKSLTRIGVDLERDCWTVHAAACRPPGDDLPPKSALYCRPNVAGAVRRLRPGAVLLLGSEAVKSVLGWLWRQAPGGVTRWEGFAVPSKEIRSWVLPTFHPSYVLQSKQPEVLQRRFDEQVSLAFSTGPLPDFPERVIEYPSDPDMAAKAIRELAAGTRPVAFDYETNMLKPDSEKGRIYCCALSDGVRTVSYPMAGEAVGATREFLDSPVPKVGANVRFEVRWSVAKLGVWPRNVVHDTVEYAHLSDQRNGASKCSDSSDRGSGTAGVKFQAFVRLGEPPYSGPVEKFLKGRKKGGYAMNRIRHLDQHTLLKYCGMDAALEWEIAEHQLGDLG